MAMDRERLLAFFRTHYLSRREVLNKLPLSMDAESFWKDLQSRRRSDAVTLPLYNPEERAYWYCLTDKMIAASERLSEEAISQTMSLDPYRMQMTGAMTEEMYFTSFVEGAQIPIQDAMDFLQRGTEPENIQEQLIWNNCQAWSMLVGSLYRPLDEEFVKTLAYILTQEMDSQAEDYRTEDGHEIAAMQGEEYRVPHAYMVPPRMGEFYAFLRQGDIHPLIKASAGQAFVLATRPFPEGNERLARMISSAVLLRSGYDFFADISISGMIAREGYRYYKAMKEILSPGNGGDMTYFMEYYLDMLVRAVDDRRERERIRQQRREEQERMSLEQEREMAKQPLAAPGAQEQAEPLEDEPEDEPEEMSGEDDPSGDTAEDGNEAAILPGDDTEDAIMSRVRAAVTEQSSEKKEDIDYAVRFMKGLLELGMNEFGWMDIRRIMPLQGKEMSRVLRKLARAEFIKNLGPNNPGAKYQIIDPPILEWIRAHTTDTITLEETEAHQELTEDDRQAFAEKYAPMIKEMERMLQQEPGASEQRIATFIHMKLTKGEADFTRAEWSRELQLELHNVSGDVARAMEYGLAVRKRPGRTDYKVFTILPERIQGPVDTDYPGFLGKTMSQLYGYFGNGRFTNLDAKRLAGDKGWKQMRENIGCLVRRRLIEQRKYSHNESEFCLSVNPQDWPVFFLPDDRKKDESARTYTGGSSYTGPAVSYAAAGV